MIERMNEIIPEHLKKMETLRVLSIINKSEAGELEIKIKLVQPAKLEFGLVPTWQKTNHFYTVA